jgi:serine phosphatase RsbU (regulator of sigma subunit)
VTVLEAAADLMLGVDPNRPRHDHTYPVSAGSTLLLYTDGLIETRTRDLDSGLERLVQSARRHYALGLDDLLDAVVAELVGDQPDDDVAVLAVRFDASPLDASRLGAR